jgi:nucleotide-binding universal stress UspA family protein
VLAWAAQFAMELDAKLEIAHVIGLLDAGFPYIPSPQSRIELETAARRELERLQIATDTQAATVHLRGGDPAREVSAMAQSAGADLLVIGRGPKDREGGRLPANAYAIIRQSPCVVISV